MQKWEYLRVKVTYGSHGGIIENGTAIYTQDTENKAEFEARLNDYFMKRGKDGWELVSECPGSQAWICRYNFKRPIEE
jgi:hypothetical protein